MTWNNLIFMALDNILFNEHQPANEISFNS